MREPLLSLRYCSILLLLAALAASCGPVSPTSPPSVPAAAETPAPSVPTSTPATQVPGPSAQEELPDCGGRTIAVIWGSLGNDFNIHTHQGALDALKEMGCQVTDSNAGGDRTRQVGYIENAVQLGVAGMVMGDVALEIIDPAIKAAKEAGIPTATCDSGSKEAIVDVTSDNFLLGIQQAYELQKYMGSERGNVIVAFEPGYRPIEIRHATWAAAMPFLCPNFKIIAEIRAHWPNTVPEAKAKMEALLKQFPQGQIDAVYTTYDLEAIGVAQAIEEAGRSEIVVVSADASPDLLDWIKKGSVIKATVGQDPYAIGRAAAIALVRYLNGEKVPSVIYVPTFIVDTDNISEYVP